MQNEFTLTTTLPANVQTDINNATDEQRQAFRDALDAHDETERQYGAGDPRTKAANAFGRSGVTTSDHRNTTPTLPHAIPKSRSHAARQMRSAAG